MTDIYQGIHIASGGQKHTSHINKFGYLSAATTTFATIWDGTSPYPYATSPLVATVVSSAPASDDGGIVEIQGLDQNFDLQTEILTIGGAPSTVTFLRIFRATVITSTTGTTNVGNVNVNINGSTLAIIKAAAGQTLMAIYTIPAGKTGYLIKIQGSIEKQKEVTFRIMARPFGSSFNNKGQFGSFGSPVTYDYPVPLKFTEKTDVEIQVKAGASTGAGAIFDMILKDN
jgi:hypothetical protein